MAYEIFDDVAFYWVAVSLLALSVLPITAYWILSALYIFIRPYLWKPDPKRFGADLNCNCPQCKENKTRQKKQEQSVWRFFRFKYFLFVVLWGLFVWSSMQMNSFKGEQMVSFEPYTILGLTPAASTAEIKRAYHKMALMHHPDKRPGDREAAKMFILITKAYEALTDPVARKKFEETGNPDGFAGNSKVTIGLPSFLTKKENELTILVLYFFLFIVLPPVSVYLWWRRANHYHESGSLRESLFIYYKILSENMSPKYLIEVLAASAEYRVLEQNPTEGQRAALKKLENEVSEYMVKQKFRVPYIIKGSLILHAHLLRVDIPEVLIPDLHFMLKNVHRYLNSMLEIALAKGFKKPMLAVVDLMQMMTQGQWMYDSPLKQLPYITDKDIKMASKRKMGELRRFINASEDERKNAYPTFTDEEWSDINAVSSVIPMVNLKSQYEVEEEEGIYVDDVVLLTITLTRLNHPDTKSSGAELQASAEVVQPQDDETETKNKTQNKQSKGQATGKKTRHDKSKLQHRGKGTSKDANKKDKPDMNKKTVVDKEKNKHKMNEQAGEPKASILEGLEGSDLVGKNDADNDDVNDEKDHNDEDNDDANDADESADKLEDNSKEEPDKQKAGTPEKQESQTQEKSAGGDKDKPKEKQPVAEAKKRDDDDDEDDIDDEKIFALANRPREDKEDDRESPVVHSLCFPFPKKEKWFIFLFDTTKASQIITLQRVHNFGARQTIKIRFRAPPVRGVYSYEIHAKCDSYFGVDVMTTFRMRVESSKAQTKVVKKNANPSDPDPEDATDERDQSNLDDEEDTSTPKWYYLYNSTFWEFLLTLVVMFLVGLFLVDWLQRKGYWDAYYTPFADRVSRAVWPVIGPYCLMVYEAILPLFKWLDRVTTRHSARYSHRGDSSDQSSDHSSGDHSYHGSESEPPDM